MKTEKMNLRKWDCDGPSWDLDGISYEDFFETPYNGIYFEYKDFPYRQLYEIKDGIFHIYKNPVTAKFVDYDNIPIRNSSALLKYEHTTGKYLLDGEPFTALTYDYGLKKQEERLYTNGYLILEIIYNGDSGELISFLCDDNNYPEGRALFERHTWFENGEYKNFYFKYSNVDYKECSFSLKFTEPNVLNQIGLDACYFKDLPFLEKEANLELIDSKSYFKDLTLDKKSRLINDGIDDEIFQNIWSNGGMEEVEELTIWWNNLTKHSFYKLLDLSNLKRVSMEFESKTMSEDAIESGKFVAKELKAKGVTVELNINGKKREV